ncbi:hypothetical protein UT300012_21740 [Paraclostridium bifermentans]
MIMRMNLFSNKETKVNCGEEEYNSRKIKNIQVLMQEINWLVNHCSHNTEVRRRTLYELGDTLERFLDKQKESRNEVSWRTSKKILDLEGKTLTRISNAVIVLKTEGSKEGLIASRNIISVLNTIATLVNNYKNIEL